MELAVILIKLIVSVATLALKLLFTILGWIFALILRHSSPTAPVMTGRGRAVDGDTLSIGQHRIRLHGIDAPEMGQSTGPMAGRMLSKMIAGRVLRVEPIERDRYGRTVARVSLEDGTDLSRAMVAAGWALAAGGSRYTGEMGEARRERRGLWANGDGIENPAAWRARQG